jgi:DNA-binding protein H-NS
MKKTDSYGSVMAEIERLQQRAQDLRKTELPGVVKRIREAIEAYGLTAADLGFGAAGAASARPARPSRQTGTKPTTNRKTWTGRGKPPLWIVGVKDRTPFLIDAGAAAPAAPAAETATPAAKPARAARKAASKPGRRAGSTAGRKRGRKATAGVGESSADAVGTSAD